MKILFILPRYNESRYAYNPHSTNPVYDYLIPVGMPSICSVLKNAGYEVDVQNQNHETGLIKDIVSNKLKNSYYDIIFTGALSMMYPNIRDLVQFIREVSPSSKIVVGGGIISAQPEIMINLLKPDYGIVFEGEETCLELVKCLESNGDCSKINGLVFRKNGDIIKTPPRNQIMNLDALPFPDFEAFGIQKYIDNQKSDYLAFGDHDYMRPYSIISTRGCAYNCTFCYHTTGPKYRIRSIENIIGEIKFALNMYRVNHFFFFDELFAYDKQRVLEFCKQLREIYDNTPWPIRMFCNLRVDCADEEIINALKSVNCVSIGLGLESYSLPILNSMKKNITP